MVSCNSAVAGTLLDSAPENVLIQEHVAETGRVLLTLATAQDEGTGLDGSGSLVQVSFTPLIASGSFELVLDLPTGSTICPWHGNFNHSVYIEESAPNSSNSFSSLINATIFIVE